MNKINSPKILVVDDDVRLRDLLSRYLTEQGFQVTAIAEGPGIGTAPGKDDEGQKSGSKRSHNDLLTT